MNAAIITIGDEILIGQIVDTNSAWIAQKLESLGMNVVEMRSIRDESDDIISTLKHLEKKAEIILITGGLGPTKDDITKNVLAHYFGDEMVFKEDVFQHVTAILQRYNIKTSAIHKEQCYFPDSAMLFQNERGTAPGMLFERNNRYYLSVPGVPIEMKHLLSTSILPYLSTVIQSAPILHKTILTVGKGEGVMAEMLQEVVDEMPEQIKLAYLPGFGMVRLRLTVRGIENEKRAHKLLVDFTERIVAKVQPWVFGYDNDLLSKVIGNYLIEKGKMMGTAESCTGGNIAHTITANSGSSSYFKGGIIAYSNEIKENVLGVQKETLMQYGAVSEQTVREMALGCTRVLGCDMAIASTGIAGPTGGTEEKPVGTVWIAATDGHQVQTRLLTLGNGRRKNIEFTTVAALNLLRKMLLKG